MSNKLSQDQVLSQSIGISAAQVQAIKMLELTSLEIDNRIERELVDNPALEENYDNPSEEGDTSDNKDDNEEDWELGDYATEDDIPAYKLRQIEGRQEQQEDIPFASAAPGIDEQLIEQLSMTNISETDLQIARYIIGNLTADGYLERSTQELQDELLFKVGLDVSLVHLHNIIERIQALDPPGIGASSLQECLLLQLRRQRPTPDNTLAQTMLQEYYEDFVAKRYERLSSALSISLAQVDELYRLISHLSPRPASALGVDWSDRLTQITPDFVVSDIDGQLQLTIVGERDIPPLRVSPDYLQLAEQARSKTASRSERESLTFLRHKIEQARWFIDAIQQRQDTLRRTMLAIIAYQDQFFRTGELSSLRPMILKDIAEATGLDISTVSRVSNSKSVQTDFGLYPLKFFFGEGITKDDGEEVSTRQIKQELSRLIEEEDKHAPLSDAQLTKALADLGYPLARRTVAKYREQLRLPIARLRREI